MDLEFLSLLNFLDPVGQLPVEVEIELLRSQCQWFIKPGIDLNDLADALACFPIKADIAGRDQNGDFDKGLYPQVDRILFTVVCIDQGALVNFALIAFCINLECNLSLPAGAMAFV